MCQWRINQTDFAFTEFRCLIKDVYGEKKNAIRENYIIYNLKEKPKLHIHLRKLNDKINNNFIKP